MPLIYIKLLLFKERGIFIDKVIFLGVYYIILGFDKTIRIKYTFLTCLTFVKRVIVENNVKITNRLILAENNFIFKQ